eukprot:4472190-Amphidinium_carterae.2
MVAEQTERKGLAELMRTTPSSSPRLPTSTAELGRTPTITHYKPQNRDVQTIMRNICLRTKGSTTTISRPNHEPNVEQLNSTTK